MILVHLAPLQIETPQRLRQDRQHSAQILRCEHFVGLDIHCQVQVHQRFCRWMVGQKIHDAGSRDVAAFREVEVCQSRGFWDGVQSGRGDARVRNVQMGEVAETGKEVLVDG